MNSKRKVPSGLNLEQLTIVTMLSRIDNYKITHFISFNKTNKLMYINVQIKKYNFRANKLHRPICQRFLNEFDSYHVKNILPIQTKGK